MQLSSLSLSLSLSLSPSLPPPPHPPSLLPLHLSLRDNLYFLQREVSFVNSLPVEVVSYIVGWIYCFVWSFYYYPQASVYPSVLIQGSKLEFNITNVFTLINALLGDPELQAVQCVWS